MSRLVPLRLHAKISPSETSPRPFPELPTAAKQSTRLPHTPLRSSRILPSAAPPPVLPKSLLRPISQTYEMRPPLPRTQCEWRQFMDEVRMMYLRRQYKQCSARCIQVLEDAEEPVVPLYSIYVSFYAASCIELTAKSLAPSSPQKIFLLELARFHYQKAEYHLVDASIGVKTCNNHSSVTSVSSTIATSSKRSSFDSSTVSVFSRINSSPMPSPTSSIYSSSALHREDSEDHLKPKPLHVKKKVVFQPMLPTVISVSGIDDKFTPSTSKQSRSYTVDIKSIRAALAPSPSASSDSTVTTTRSGADSDSNVASHTGNVSWELYSNLEPARSIETEDTESTFSLSRSIARYKALLGSMSTQLHYHITVLEALIENLQIACCGTGISTTDKTCSNTLGCATIDTSQAQDIKRGNEPELCASFENLGRESLEEAARQEKRRRLRKCRMDKWRMGERFDGKRWQVLAEKALRELNC